MLAMRTGESGFPMRSGRKFMNAKALVTTLVALAMFGCTPDWAKQGDAPVVLLMTSINNGSPLDSDLRISNGGVCPDFVPLRLENHFKNPHVTATGFRHDFTVERYEVRYFRSDGRNTEGVDVPYRISGNVALEVIEESTATLQLEVVRRQAKLEPPLVSLDGSNPPVLTAFAEVTLWARTTTNQTTNTVSARLQIDFANFGDTLTACPTTTQ
jgi:hypothetical protein